jgi:hypothetical protein
MGRGFSALLSGMLIGGVLNTMAGVIATETTGQRVGRFLSQSSELAPGPNPTNGGIAFMADGAMRMKIASDGIISIYNADGSERLRIDTGGSISIHGEDNIERLPATHAELVGISKFGRFKAESAMDIAVGSKETTIAKFGRENGEEFQSLIEFRTLKSLIHSGDEIGRGAIRLIDNIASPERTMELGYYQYGAGIFTDNLFEFWTDGVSIAGFGGTSSFLAVRDSRDLGDLRLRHDGSKGIIETTGSTGFDPGGIQIGGNGPHTFSTKSGTVMTITDEGNIGVGLSDVHEFGNGAGVIGIANASAIPVTNPTGGGALYVEDGALKYRGPLGTVTTLAHP